VRASVIGLVGIAPKGPLQSLTVVNGEVSAAQFGQQVHGFSIPQALDAIFKQGRGTTVVVLNVFDPDTMVTAVADEEQTTAGGFIQLDYAPKGEVDSLKDGDTEVVPVSV
jgi:phage tail sheath protein FI